MNAQEMIQRYAHAAAKRLPLSRRADIQAELTGLLSEEVAARVKAGETEVDAARTVIEAFGRPQTVALDYHHAVPVIEPRHTRLFTQIVVSLTAALVVLAISVILSDPEAIGDPDFARRITNEAATGALQVFGFMLLIFWAAGAWSRHCPAPRWSVDRLPAISDPDAVNRPLNLFAIVGWSAGLMVLVLGPARVVDLLANGAAPQPLLDAFAYAPDFTGLRANLLWTALALSLLISAWPLIAGRRSPGWRHLSAAASVVLSLLLYGLVLSGDIFTREPTNEYMKFAMAVFAGWALIDGVSGLLLFRQRPAGPPSLHQT